MKTLQNNFTTPDQSKRLLELGLPEDSADCYYHHYFTNDPTPLLRVLQPQWDETIGAIRGKSGQKIEPCWSVGRLIEIMEMCSPYSWKQFNFCGTLIEQIVKAFEFIAGEKCFDFSKLED